jgi:hypothetical protein
MPESENSAVPLEPKFSALRDQYASFSDFIKPADNLINQRTTWHTVIQGLLLAHGRDEWDAPFLALEHHDSDASSKPDENLPAYVLTEQQ